MYLRCIAYCRGLIAPALRFARHEMVGRKCIARNEKGLFNVLNASICVKQRVNVIALSALGII
jgi:hypothetical protein